MQCSRCGARWAEQRSCGKTIHLELPPLPRGEPTSGPWFASVLSDTFSAETLTNDEVKAAVEALGWKIDSAEDPESGCWNLMVPDFVAEAIGQTGIEIVVPNLAVQISIDVP